MFIASTVTIFLVIYFMGNNTLWYSVIVSLIAGVVATLTEMWTREGWDTLSVPLVIVFVLQLGTII